MISYSFKKSLENGKVPNCLKLANIMPVFKKGAHTSKNNYRLASNIDLTIQLLEFLDNILPKFQFSFRKNCETQHCLLLMLEIWKGDSKRQLLSVLKFLVQY